MAVKVELVDVTFVDHKLEEVAVRVQVDSFQFSCLKVAPFVAIQAHITACERSDG